MLDLLAAGVDAFRLNCSHASMDELQRDVELIRSCSRQIRRSSAVVMDLQGPRLRVGRLRNGEPVHLKNGARVRITTTSSRHGRGVLHQFQEAAQDREEGHGGPPRRRLHRPLRAPGPDGLGGLRGPHRRQLEEHKGINLPGAHIDLPALTPRT